MVIWCGVVDVLSTPFCKGYISISMVCRSWALWLRMPRVGMNLQCCFFGICLCSFFGSEQQSAGASLGLFSAIVLLMA